INPLITDTKEFSGKFWASELYSNNYIKNKLSINKQYTLSYKISLKEKNKSNKTYSDKHGLRLFYRGYPEKDVPTEISINDINSFNEKNIVKQFNLKSLDILNIIAYSGRYTGDGTIYGDPIDNNDIYIKDLK